MSIKNNKSLILNKIKSYLGFNKDAEFARFLNIKPQTLSTWHSRNTFDIDLLYSKCRQINANWLLTGEGPMLQEEVPIGTSVKQDEGIPLIPVEVFAGATPDNDHAINFETVKDKYKIPLFEGKGIDFLMYVHGASMDPTYSSGDVVACRFVKGLPFIQWNKAYVLDSKSHGTLIARLVKSDNPENIVCRSDDKAYADFEVPLNNINNIALIVGCIRLE